mgnify:CR=1 FL=1
MEKDNEISFLKSKIKNIQNTLNYWKDKFKKLIFFLHDNDDKVLDDDIEELDLSKEKDDFER